MTSNPNLIAQIETLLDERITPLIDEIARLRTRIQRPDLQKYTIEESCERMKRSRSSIYAIIMAGEITPVKERGRTFLTEEEIQRWERTQRN